MAEQVNLLSIIEGTNLPLKDRVAVSMRLVQQLFETTWPSLDLLERHINETSGGMIATGTPVQDNELAFHHLFLQQLGAMLDELAKKVRQVENESERRIWTTITNRGSDAFVAYGKKFTAEGDLIPTPPSEKAPEYGELLQWCADSGWEGIIKTSIPWQSLKKLCETLAEQGQPMPPHVKLSPKTGVRVSVSR